MNRSIISGLAVYYSVYSSDEILSSKHAISSSDDFVGHLSPFKIPPPHIGSAILKFILRREGLSAEDEYDLYVDFTSPTPVDPGAHINLTTEGYPGFNPERPLAVVLRGEAQKMALIAAVGSILGV